MSRVLLTGANGAIGRFVLPILVARGYEVHAVRSQSGEAGQATAWHRADLLDPEARARLVDDVQPELLVHLAWHRDRDTLWGSPRNEDWADAGVELWRRFAERGGRRGLVVGTCAEYEWGAPVLSEVGTPLQPATAYGRGKSLLRQRLEGLGTGGTPSLVWPRVFFVYGAEADEQRLVPHLAACLLAGRPARSTDGSQVRDYLYAGDVAAALVELLESEAEGPVNVGSGAGTVVRDMVTMLGELSGRPDLIELGAVPRQEGEPDTIVADVSRLRALTGWRPAVGLREGLSETLEQMRALSAGA